MSHFNFMLAQCMSLRYALKAINQREAHRAETIKLMNILDRSRSYLK